MANSAKGLIKETNHMGGTDYRFELNKPVPGWLVNVSNGVQVTANPDVGSLFSITCDLVKNPNDASEAVLASAKLQPSDWAAGEAIKQIFTYSNGIEADNGSTPTLISWILNTADMLSGGVRPNVYALRFSLAGHGDAPFEISADFGWIKCPSNNAGRIELETFIHDSAE